MKVSRRTNTGVPGSECGGCEDGASGNSKTANSGTATTTSANELIFGAGTLVTK